MFRRARPLAPLPSAPAPTVAELKVRVALASLDQAAQSAANRSVGLDTKASILLVIAGIIVTSSFSGDALLFRIAACIALLSSVAALVSLWPRKIPGAHPSTITDHLVAGKSESVAAFEFWLLALHKAAAIAREKHMALRGKWLLTGFILAVVALLVGGASMIHEGDWLASWLGSYEQAARQDSTPSPSTTPR